MPTWLFAAFPPNEKNIRGSDFFIEAFKMCSKYPMFMLLLVTVNSLP